MEIIMEKLKKVLKQNVNIIFVCLFELIVGILMLIDPDGFTSAVIIIGGIVLMGAGLYGTRESGYKQNSGDLIFFNSNGINHIGIVVWCDGSTVYTIEGNTSWANYKNQCLNEKKRSLDWSAKNYSTGEVSYIMGVLRPDFSGIINASDVK